MRVGGARKEGLLRAAGRGGVGAHEIRSGEVSELMRLGEGKCQLEV